ncbi:MAG: 2-succinyl-5-enolpyruvyl-6-hydroxy-3-cyclohexene-1-carboxylic-acid synthase [Streptococcaceae bacterium]|nr:2-succinyl-5-enolpyruvyl-6-hydroxy-3-cyclohexene-1-carboxylic-acid synthase [Streptococcaceae bacterium]MCL2858914.1 2-succinyl-5-enolpyruvyl-6-hydroxy-3-cyclohexene-1-carboxylic-acid synthase [Streptococcaceae bacterium]
MMNNEYLAPFVDELYTLGVREVVFSPGSRSTTLALLFEEYKQFKTYLNIDERSAGFFALGIAKVQERPVVLVCTSGSAGAHYLPALTEAKHSRIPLIVLTADRPNHLQFVGAPQTVNQNHYFGDFVSHYEEFSHPAEKIYWTYPRKVAQRAIMASTILPESPVHINLPIDEPLIPDLNPEHFQKGKTNFSISHGSVETASPIKLLGKALIIVGPDSKLKAQKEILNLAELLQAPILADPLSNLRSFESPYLIDSYDAFLADSNLCQELSPDTIIQIGQIPVSKRLQAFISANNQTEYIQVEPTLNYRNPQQTTTQIIQSDIASFCQSVISSNPDSNYLAKWQKAQSKMRKQLNTVSTETQAFEGRYIQAIQENMPENSQILVANSMSIREVDYFWEAKSSSAKLYGNRGTNGIDGQESTALGISTNEKPTVLITGDLSMLHDINGLIMGKTHKLNLTIVLFNNDGGGIFHHLAQKEQPHFDYLFSTPHGTDFSALATLTGLDYRLIKDYQDFDSHFKQALSSSGIHLLEVKTDKDLSLELHKKYTTYDI